MQHELAVSKTSKSPEKRGRPSLTGVEDCLNGKLHIIQAHDGKVTRTAQFPSTEERKAEEKHNFIVTGVQGSQGSASTSVLPTSYSEEVQFGM